MLTTEFTKIIEKYCRGWTEMCMCVYVVGGRGEAI